MRSLDPLLCLRVEEYMKVLPNDCKEGSEIFAFEIQLEDGFTMRERKPKYFQWGFISGYTPVISVYKKLLIV